MKKTIISSCVQYLDDLFKGQGKAKHHRSLRGNHLLVNGVVEMGHLQHSDTFTI